MATFTPLKHSISSIISRITALEQNHVTLSELFIRLEYQICNLHGLPKNTSMEDEIAKLKEDSGNQIDGIEEFYDNQEPQVTKTEIISPVNQSTEMELKTKRNSSKKKMDKTSGEISRYKYESNHHKTPSKKRAKDYDIQCNEKNLENNLYHKRSKKNSFLKNDVNEGIKPKTTIDSIGSYNHKDDFPKQAILSSDKAKISETDMKVKNNQVLESNVEMSKISSSAKQIKPSQDVKTVSNYTSSIFTSLKSSSKEVCICRQPKTHNMIGCDFCDESYHNRCLKLSTEDVKEMKKDKWQCPKCKMSANSAIDKSKVSKEFFAIFAKMCSKGQFPATFKAAA